MASEFEMDRLRRVVLAVVDAMRATSPRTMRDAPFRRFGVQYNRFRGEAMRMLPDLAGLIPPRVPVGRKLESGDAPIEARYLELRCYLAAIGELLTPAPEACGRSGSELESRGISAGLIVR